MAKALLKSSSKRQRVVVAPKRCFLPVSNISADISIDLILNRNLHIKELKSVLIADYTQITQ